MTDEEAAAIAARAAAATPGPWHTLGDASIYTVDDTTEVADWISRNDADVAFIAHAREDIPALLAERAELLEIVQVVADYTAEHSDYSGYYECQFCGVERREEPSNIQDMTMWLTHTSDCPVTKARAILGEDASTH